MDRFCDLHIHSVYSDGTMQPDELIRLAEKTGLMAVALCDHNTVAGLPDFLRAAEESCVEAVPGIEFSTDYAGTELHMLGLFIRPEYYAAVSQKVAWMREEKDRCNRDLMKALGKDGILLDYGVIQDSTPDGLVNRAVIAAEMVRKGYCESVKDAFSRWLSVKCGYYREPKRLDVFDVIRFIKSIGAVAVLAHPFLNLQEQALRQFLSEAVEYGLDGMEVYYPRFDDAQTALAEQIADSFALLKSGGSDFHGDNKPDIEIGKGTGSLQVPLELLERLRLRQENNIKPNDFLKQVNLR